MLEQFLIEPGRESSSSFSSFPCHPVSSASLFSSSFFLPLLKCCNLPSAKEMPLKSALRWQCMSPSFKKLVDTALGRNLGFLNSLLNSWPSLCHPDNEKCVITCLSKGIVWVLFFSTCFTCFPGFIQAPAYLTNNTVNSSSIELSHFLSNVIHEGMIDYKHTVLVWRDEWRESTLWNYSISCTNCQALIQINLFYCSFSSIPPFNCCFGMMPLSCALWMFLT